MRNGTVIAIDPDIDKNGVAFLDRDSHSCCIECLNFPETLEYVKTKWQERNPEKPFDVIVEAGWLNHGNWHVTESRNGKFSPQAWAAAVGTSTGECNAVSKKLLECFAYYGIEARPIKPLRKCWRGPNRKITHDELCKEMFMYRVKFPYKRSNPETRDAALIALVNL